MQARIKGNIFLTVAELISIKVVISKTVVLLMSVKVGIFKTPVLTPVKVIIYNYIRIKLNSIELYHKT